MIEYGAALEKLAVIALIGATMTMQLVLARAAAGSIAPQSGSPQLGHAPAQAPPVPPGPPASRIFDDAQIHVLRALQRKLQGRTRKQQNPYAIDVLGALNKKFDAKTARQRNPNTPHSLAWAAWTIARLGGWTGYHSDKSAGPITMRDGLQRFNAIVDGYELSQDVCPS